MVLHRKALLIFPILVKLSHSINPKINNTTTCNKPDGSAISWFSCRLVTDKWFGVTKQPVSVAGAQEACNNAGGELFYTKDQNDDVCAYYAIGLAGKDDQLVLYSGRYSAFSFSAFQLSGSIVNLFFGTVNINRTVFNERTVFRSS